MRPTLFISVVLLLAAGTLLLWAPVPDAPGHLDTLPAPESDVRFSIDPISIDDSHTPEAETTSEPPSFARTPDASLEISTFCSEIMEGSVEAALLLTKRTDRDSRRAALELMEDPEAPLAARNLICYGISLTDDHWSYDLQTLACTSGDPATKLFALSALSNVAPLELQRLYHAPDVRRFLYTALTHDEFVLRTHAIIAMGATGDRDVLLGAFKAETDPRFHGTYARALMEDSPESLRTTLLAHFSGDMTRTDALRNLLSGSQPGP